MNDHADATPTRFARRTALGAVLILLLTFGVYWPVLLGGFVWDDLILVDKNPLVTGEVSFRSIWFGQDFPLANVVLWLEWLAWGKRAAGFHVVNVLLHATSAILFWRVLLRLGIVGAWLAAVLFVVHPVCVASVGWISELKNTLSLPFYLASLWLFLVAEARVTDTPDFKARLCYFFSLLGFLFALLSKTSTVMLPVILLACAWWRRGRIVHSDVVRTIPFFALALVFGCLTIWFQTQQVVRGEIVQAGSFWVRLASAGTTVWFYLGKALLPLNLCMIYPRWTVEAGSLSSFVPLLLLVAAFAGCWWFRAGWARHVLFALGFFVVSLFPVLGFFDMYFMVFSPVSDHFAYLALLPVVALVGGGLGVLPSFTMRFTTGLLVVAVLGTLTWQRAEVFASNQNLWTDTLSKNPAAWNAHNNLGCIRAERGKLDEAVRHFEASLKLNPRNTKALVNLARARALQNNSAEAEILLQRALKLRSDDADVYAQLGSLFASSGRFEEALRYLREAVHLRPDAATRMELADTYRAAGRTGEASGQWRELLLQKPDHPDALSNLAWLLATAADGSLRNGTEAVGLAERACTLTGFKDAQKVGVLAAAYAEAGQFDKAVATARKAGELAWTAGNMEFASANQQLMQLYASRRPYHEPPPPTVQPK